MSFERVHVGNTFGLKTVVYLGDLWTYTNLLVVLSVDHKRDGLIDTEVKVPKRFFVYVRMFDMPFTAPSSVFY